MMGAARQEVNHALGRMGNGGYVGYVDLLDCPDRAVVFLIRWLAVSPRGQEAPRESAEEILKKRYARGEMDKEEYERKLEGLRK